MKRQYQILGWAYLQKHKCQTNKNYSMPYRTTSLFILHPSNTRWNTILPARYVVDETVGKRISDGDAPHHDKVLVTKCLPFKFFEQATHACSCDQPTLHAFWRVWTVGRPSCKFLGFWAEFGVNFSPVRPRTRYVWHVYNTGLMV